MYDVKKCLQFTAYDLCLRLKEIEMSEYDAATYERFSGAVRRQVQSLRIILDSLQVNVPYQPLKKSVVIL